MVQVLVVEDSAVVRDYLVFALESDPDIKVIGTADSGEAALQFLAKRRPDAILMDLHLPGIDGLETTRQIMSSCPVAVVVCSASTQNGDTRLAMRALEAGALAVLKKPRGLTDPHAEAELAELVTTLKLMSEVRLVRRWNRAPAVSPLPATPATGPGVRVTADGTDATVVAIGASTGGPPVVLQILSGLAPSFAAPVLVVQHIAAGFTAGFVKWLSEASGLPVHVAEDGTLPLAGHVYVAPDDRHLRVGPLGRLLTTRDAPHHGLRPAVGVLFRSVAELCGRRAVGVLLTGMGRDGADELKLMADRGALTIAQDRESCVVYGMPAEAIRLGAARYVLPPSRIAEALNTAVSFRTKQGENDAR